MAKFTKIVEAEQFLPKDGDKQKPHVVVSGSYVDLNPTDYVIYDKGQIVAVQSAAKFEAEHTPLAEEEAPKKGKK